MDESQQQIAERLKEANNVLITTKSSPSVDQLAATIGLTLLLNKAGKHATAVFSGAVPSTIEFLEPEKTLEKNTDSLRDFIIALDKSKADKLRYKVEDSHVKIFITPYRTSISEKDLEFSQGDFNVDLVVLLGVHDQKDLDQAITAHGRIFHDATVVSLAKDQGNNLGAVNWIDPTASSISEMLVGFIDQLKGADGQIATALLTGIVAETERFSNNKTTATTMANSARLMASGANQQLVATELQPKPAPVPEPVPTPAPAPAPAPIPSPLQALAEQDQDKPVEEKPAEQSAAPAPAQKSADGALQINHEDEDKIKPLDTPVVIPEDEPDEDPLEQIHIDEDGSLHPITEQEDKPSPVQVPAPEVQAPSESERSSIMSTPPTLGGALTATSEPSAGEDGDVTSDPLSLSSLGNKKLLSHDSPIGSEQEAVAPAPAPEPEYQLAEDHSEVHGHITIQPPEHHDTVPITELAKQEDPGASVLPQPGTAVVEQGQTLSQIESQIGGLPVEPGAAIPPHVSEDQARDAVTDAVAGLPQTLPPPVAFNAQTLDMDVQAHDTATPPEQGISGLPSNLVPPAAPPQFDTTASPLNNAAAPPTAPPPVMPPPGFVQPPSNPGPGQAPPQ
jgi:hypothetical protein